MGHEDYEKDNKEYDEIQLELLLEDKGKVKYFDSVKHYNMNNETRKFRRKLRAK